MPMDVSLTRDSIRVNEPLFDGSAEHPVDCEIILPDYCPDIARVLKTEAAVNIDSRTLEGNGGRGILRPDIVSDGE